MRIVRLSETEPHFHTHDNVRRFFRKVIWRRQPLGKFRVTLGRIA